MNVLLNIWDYFIMLIPQIIDALFVTLKLFSITLILSIPLGLLVATAQLSKFTIINKVASLYILILRGTPLLLQIVFVFFGLATVGIVFDRFTAAIITFTLNYSAYFGEIFRAGITSINKGQWEASTVLGFSKTTTFFKIILPQAFKVVLPPIGNEVVTLVKDTALVYIIGLDELIKVGKNAVNRDGTLLPLIFIGLIYIFLTFIFTKCITKLESRYSYYR